MPRIVISGSGGGGGVVPNPIGTFPDGMIGDGDYESSTYPSPTQEVHVYRVGGVGGTIVRTVTVNYVDAFKDNLLNVAWT